MEEKHFGPVWFIPGENHGKYPYCHSIYIEGSGVLIDPSSNRKRLMQLRDAPGVQEIWLTHFHEDHIRDLDLFKDIPVCISEIDAGPLSDMDLYVKAYGFDEEYMATKRISLQNEFNFQPRKADRYLRNGELIRLNNVTVEVIATPGHTPGHLSFFFQEFGVLFLGDYDLTSFGPWYGDADSSMEATVLSVKWLREIPAKVWLTSHEKGIFESEPGEAWERYLSVMDTREKKLLKVLETPKTLEEIVDTGIVYGKLKKIIPFAVVGEKALMKKHLERLICQNLVTKDNGSFVRLS